MYLVQGMLNMGHLTYSRDFLQNLVKTTSLVGNQEFDIITLLTSKSGCVRPVEMYHLFTKAVLLIDKKIKLVEKPLEIPGEMGREILHRRLEKLKKDFMKANALLEEYSKEVRPFLEIIFGCREAVEILKYSLRTSNPSGVVPQKTSPIFSDEKKMGDVLFSLLQKIWKGDLNSSIKKAYEENTPIAKPDIQKTTGAMGEEAERTLLEGLKKLYAEDVEIHTGVYIRFSDGKVAERDVIVVDRNKQLLAVIECKANPHTGFSCAEQQVKLTEEELKEGGVLYKDRKCKNPIKCTYTGKTAFLLASPGRFYPFSYKITTKPILLKRSILLVVAHLYSIEKSDEDLPMGILEEAIKKICSSNIPLVPDRDYHLNYNEIANTTFIRFAKQPSYESLTKSVEIQKLTEEF